jgi:ECF sigma factor
MVFPSPGGPAREILGSMADVTRLLDVAAAGEPHAAADQLPLVYDELRKLAAARMAEEKPGQTLQGTALVHEAYARLVGGAQPRDWDLRGHFFAAAAEAMHRIFVNKAPVAELKVRWRGDLDAEALAAPEPDLDLAALVAALKRSWPDRSSFGTSPSGPWLTKAVRGVGECCSSPQLGRDHSGTAVSPAARSFTLSILDPVDV